MEYFVSFVVLILNKICDIIFHLTSLANLFTVVGLPLTIYAVYYAKKAFEHQQVLGAWSLLAQKGTGDLGRKDALEFLNSRGKSLAGLDLSNAHLVGLKLNGADLTGCNFTGANLTSAVFEGAMLYDSHFEGANLWKANFEGAKLSDSHFEDANLIDTHFEGAHLWGAHFDRVKLWHAHFEGATLCKANFKGADLGDAHFEDVDLGDAHFEGAKNEPATFKDCYVSKYAKNMPFAAREGYEYIFDQNEDGTQKTKVVDGVKCYYIKLIKTETKNP